MGKEYTLSELNIDINKTDSPKAPFEKSRLDEAMIWKQLESEYKRYIKLLKETGMSVGEMSKELGLSKEYIKQVDPSLKLFRLGLSDVREALSSINPALGKFAQGLRGVLTGALLVTKAYEQFVLQLRSTAVTIQKQYQALNMQGPRGFASPERSDAFDKAIRGMMEKGLAMGFKERETEQMAGQVAAAGMPWQEIPKMVTNMEAFNTALGVDIAPTLELTKNLFWKAGLRGNELSEAFGNIIIDSKKMSKEQNMSATEYVDMFNELYSSTYLLNNNYKSTIDLIDRFGGSLKKGTMTADVLAAAQRGMISGGPGGIVGRLAMMGRYGLGGIKPGESVLGGLGAFMGEMGRGGDVTYMKGRFGVVEKLANQNVGPGASENEKMGARTLAIAESGMFPEIPLEKIPAFLQAMTSTKKGSIEDYLKANKPLTKEQELQALATNIGRSLKPLLDKLLTDANRLKWITVPDIGEVTGGTSQPAWDRIARNKGYITAEEAHNIATAPSGKDLLSVKLFLHNIPLNENQYTIREQNGQEIKLGPRRYI